MKIQDQSYNVIAIRVFRDRLEAFSALRRVQDQGSCIKKEVYFCSIGSKLPSKDLLKLSLF